MWLTSCDVAVSVLVLVQGIVATLGRVPGGVGLDPLQKVGRERE